MKKTFYIFLLLLVTACGQENPDQKNIGRTSDSLTANKRFVETENDSLQANITVDFVTGQFDYRFHPAFVQVAPEHSEGVRYLQKKTYRAFKKMYKAAREDGVKLTIISGTRNFADQKEIWEQKWQNFEASTPLQKALKILNWSSMPMTSRHHWGTDVDLNNLSNDYFESGKGQKVYRWLKNHANEFGFYQPYTDKSLHGRTGYNMEKWHWSYVPLASKYREYYNNHLTNADITGFKGSALADEIDMVGKYVNGVSLKIKKYSK